jgi:acyl-CoA thioesterase-1
MIEFSRYRRKLLAILGAACLLPGCVHAQKPSAQVHKILVIGDSLSAEYGIKRNTGWVMLLQQKLTEKNTQHIVVNASISGDTTHGGISRLPALLEREHPTIVLIELGANDALRGLSLKASDANLDRMIKMAQSMHAQVLLIGMQIPPNYGKQYTEAFQQMFVNLAKINKIKLVPFLFEGMATNRALFQDDGMHPNETAQPLMMETVLSELEPMLKALPRPNHP